MFSRFEDTATPTGETPSDLFPSMYRIGGILPPSYLENTVARCRRYKAGRKPISPQADRDSKAA
ncbi:MAG: hypothetical protein ACI9HK_003255 [Pirellulaceae bacterium]|jgi:hypothetical protein